MLVALNLSMRLHVWLVFFHQIWKCKTREITLHSWSWCFFSFLWHPYGPKALSWCKASPADTEGTELKGAAVLLEQIHTGTSVRATAAAWQNPDMQLLSVIGQSQNLLQQVLQYRQETEVQWNFDANAVHNSANKIRCKTKLFTMFQRDFFFGLFFFLMSFPLFSYHIIFSLLSLKVVLRWQFSFPP